MTGALGGSASRSLLDNFCGDPSIAMQFFVGYIVVGHKGKKVPLHEKVGAFGDAFRVLDLPSKSLRNPSMGCQSSSLEAHETLT